jgi:C4-dicarboxylate transporter DctM subunit
MKTKYVTGAVVTSIALFLTGCSGGSAGAGGSSEETYDWDMTISVGNTSTWHAGAEKFKEVLEEESGGRMKLNIFTNEQLSGGSLAAGVEQLMNGEKAFSYNSTIIYAGLNEKFGAINAPFLYESYEQADAAIEASALDAYKKLGAEDGVEVLGFGESGFRQITNNVRPINQPSDLQGIKLRIPGITLFQDIYRNLGANPATMNFAEVFTALQQGTIDGQENPLDVIHSSGLSDVQKYLTMWNYVYDPVILGMNKDMFDALSPEDQEIVRKAAGEANALQKQQNRDKEESQLKELSESMEVTELTKDQLKAFRDVVAPLYDTYTPKWGPDLADAVQPK